MNLRKLTAAAMSATMLLSAPFTAYADEVGGAQKEIESGSLVDNKTTVSVPVTATINSSFTVSLPSKMELAKDEHASSYSYSGLVGVKGDIDADAVVKVKPDAKVTMYDVTYRPSEVETTPSSEEEQSYVHKDPTDVTSSQPVTTWLQSELSSGTAGSGYSMSGEYHSTDFGLSVASLSSGKWEGVINFNINYDNGQPLEAGLYNESGVMTASWGDLVADSTVHVTDGVVTTNYLYGTNSSSDALVGKLVIPDSVTSIGNNAFGYCSGLTSITIPDSVTSIGDYAFYNCSGLTSITIPNSVTSIGDSAFCNCSGLTSVKIPDGVTSISSYAFQNVANIVYNGSATGSPWNAKCVNGYLEGDFVYSDSTKTKLCAYIGNDTSVTIPNSVTSIGSSAFYNCSGLTSITIPDSVTSIGSSAFYNCSGLTSVTIPDSVTSIGERAFGYCSSLTSVNIPDSVTSIGDFAFQNCSGLTSITIPDGVTSIGSYAFYGCSGLTSITIPSSVTSIGNNAFNMCSSLTSVTIPNSVTSIGSSAFEYCTGLTSITIPSSVTSIGNNAFNMCSSLTSVTFNTTSGWYVGNSAGAKTTALSSSDLANTSTAATYLKSTYNAKYWTR